MELDEQAARVSLLLMTGTPHEQIAEQLGLPLPDVLAAADRAAAFAASAGAAFVAPTDIFDAEAPRVRKRDLRDREPLVFDAASPGLLPDAGPVALAGAVLPAGRPSEARGHEPAMWVTDSSVPDVAIPWSVLSDAFASTGLWPLVVGDVRDDHRPAPFPAPHSSRAARFLEMAWTKSYFPPDELAADEEHPLEPFRATAPTPAPSAERYDRRAPVRVLQALGSQRLALVPTHRPADVIAHIGWSGAVNHTGDISGLASVLRSWEDRFGALLVGLGTDTLVLAVQGPPTSTEAALPIAAEQYAFCPDTVDQGFGTIRALADEITRSVRWRFWWD